jgi:hypothetical protein
VCISIICLAVGQTWFCVYELMLECPFVCLSGHCFLQQGQPHEAATLFKKALSIFSVNSQDIQGLCKVCMLSSCS